MSVANIARWGYAQTLSGAWDLGEGVQLGLGIDEPRGARFTLELFGPTPALLRVREKALAVIERCRDGAHVEVPRDDALAIVMASLTPLRLDARPTRPFLRVLRSAYALGAPLGGDDGAFEERRRDTFAAALARRDDAGLGFDLARVAEQLGAHIAARPYFSDGEDPRWWEVGLIVIPLPPEAPTLELPRAVLLFARTDPAGKVLALTAQLTVGDRVIAAATRVLARAPQALCEEQEIETMEGWT